MSKQSEPGLVEKIIDAVPEQVKHVIVPAVCGIGTLTVLMAPAEMVQELAVYLGMAMTGITSYVEYRKSRNKPELPGDGSGE